MRPQDYCAHRLPPEWREAIRGAQKKPDYERCGPEDEDDGHGDYATGPFVHSPELQELVGRLKRERVERGLTLGDIAKLTQQARSAISRLENGRYSNPTLNTLYRYARALGLHIRLSVQPVDDAPK